MNEKIGTKIIKKKMELEEKLILTCMTCKNKGENKARGTQEKKKHAQQKKQKKKIFFFRAMEVSLTLFSCCWRGLSSSSCPAVLHAARVPPKAGADDDKREDKADDEGNGVCAVKRSDTFFFYNQGTAH